MARVDEWIGGPGMPGARLVRMQTGRTKQSFNICRSSNVLGEYEVSFVIDDPDHFLSPREFSGCRTIEELVEQIRRHHGKEREA